MTHGGGATMVAQPNDTDLNNAMRKAYIAAQTKFFLEKYRRPNEVPLPNEVLVGGGLCDCTDVECIALKDRYQQ